MPGVKVWGKDPISGQWVPLLVGPWGETLVHVIANEQPLFNGTATDGGVDYLEDLSQYFGQLLELKYCILEVYIGGVWYRTPIIEHTYDTLYFDALPVPVAVGCDYLVRKKVSEGIRPFIYNVDITDGSTEYSQALPSITKKFMIHTRDGTAFRVAFETGKVATPTEPYFSVPANQAYYEDFIEAASLTLYFACAGGAGINKKVEIIAWT
jgi:hypothetical protein